MNRNDKTTLFDKFRCKNTMHTPFFVNGYSNEYKMMVAKGQIRCDEKSSD